jgi:hypothetical protein
MSQQVLCWTALFVVSPAADLGLLLVVTLYCPLVFALIQAKEP